MSENDSSPIPCEDSDGNRYTVYQAPSHEFGDATSDDLKNPTWYLRLDGEVVRVIWDKDSETGKEIFICPKLEYLKLFPLN